VSSNRGCQAGDEWEWEGEGSNAVYCLFVMLTTSTRQQDPPNL
jgi:hypothetical protein